MARTQTEIFATRGATPTVGTATTVSHTSAVSSAVVDKPTVQDGTLLIAQVAWGGNPSTITPPSGWTVLVSTTLTGTYRSAAYTKYIATAASESPTTYTWSWTSAQTASIVVLPVYGVSSNQQVDGVVSAHTSQAGGTATPSTVLTPPTNVLAVSFAVAETDAGATLTAPTQMTESANVGGARQAFATETRSTGGAIGGSTSTTTFRSWTTSPATTVSAWLICIRPTDTATWTKPNWAKVCRFICIGGGGGGGSGRKGAASTNRASGAGGAGGSKVEVTVPAALLPATGAVVVGGGGSGGAAQTADSTSGRLGGSGGVSSITFAGYGTFEHENPSSGGNGGTTSAVGGGSVGTSSFTAHDRGSSGATGNTTAGAAGNTSIGGASGGGAGAGISSANAVGASGGAGGLIVGLKPQTIARRGTAQSVVQNTAGTAVTSALPSGIIAGDLIIFVLHNNTQATITVSPTGYTFVRRITDSTVLATDVWFKIATSGSESAPTATLSADSKWITHIVAYSGTDAVNPLFNPFLENGTGEGTTGTNHTTPSVINSDANAWAIAAYCTRGGTADTWTADPATTELLDDTNTGTSQLSALYADSNGPVTPVTHSYTAVSTLSSGLATMWLGYLNPISGINNGTSGGNGADGTANPSGYGPGMGGSGGQANASGNAGNGGAGGLYGGGGGGGGASVDATGNSGAGGDGGTGAVIVVSVG